MMKKTIFAAAAVLGLAACGDSGDRAAELSAKADAAVEERALADAVLSAVDLDAAKGIAEGVAKDALREALPGGEVAAAIIDEEAFVDGLGKAIDEHAIGQSVKDVVGAPRGQSVSAPAE